MIMGESLVNREKRAVLGFLGDFLKQLYRMLTEENGKKIDQQIFEINSSRERM